MRFEILGPLRVTDLPGSTPTLVSAPRLRVLLAGLLLHANQPVATGELAALVWDGAPPPGALESVRAYVMRLRRALGPLAGARVVTRDPGYLVEVGEAELDVLAFEALCVRAGAAASTGRWADVSTAAAEALRLWRAEPLVDIPAQGLRDRWLPRLERLQLQATEWRTDAELHLGRHAQLVPQLRDLCRAHPLGERFHAQLMLALARCGQRGAALEVYRQVRGNLIDELGIEPGPELRAVQQRILDGAEPPAHGRLPEPAAAEPAALPLAAPSAVDPPPDPPAGRPAAPRQLPAAVRHFAGRERELRALSGGLDDGDTVVISAIGGTAGVGKTALAVHWAQQIADRYPDGQLYLNLRGYDPHAPVPPDAALAILLRALGVASSEIPPELEERAARYRSLLAGRRVLVLLDNAGTAEQVRPLLPGTPGCLVLITSRDTLAGLVAREGARRIDLDMLDGPDSVALLRMLAGERVDAEPAAAAELARQCAHLPLALRIAAERAAVPDTTLTDVVADLADERRRLDLLDAGGDPHSAVRTVLSWSYRYLDAGTARAFRLLGLHPGHDFDAHALAALTGTALSRGRQVLADLNRASLVQPTGRHRFAQHDLLRAYARELAGSLDTDAERAAATARLSDHYLRTAAAAMDAARLSRPDCELPPGDPPPRWDAAGALAWLEAERPNLVAVAEQDAAAGRHRRVIVAAATLHRFLYVGGHHADAFAVHGCAVRAAGALGDRAAQAGALCDLAVAAANTGHGQVTERLRQALTLFSEARDRPGAARALLGLGLREKSAGRYAAAVDYYRQALAEYGDDSGNTARLLVNLGELETLLGEHGAAGAHLDAAVALCRRIGDRSAEAAALDGRGTLHRRLGDLDRADRDYRDALRITDETGFRYGSAYVALHRADVDRCRGWLRVADAGYRAALARLGELGDHGGVADAHNGLGQVALADGRSRDATGHHATALDLARQAGDRYQQARAHAGLAAAYRAAGDTALARRHLDAAAAQHAALGTAPPAPPPAGLDAPETTGRAAVLP
jgi:DNA-binding SARP family transcriptional activator